MSLPSFRAITNASFLLDGGTIIIDISGDDDQRHTIILWEHMSRPRPGRPNPGRGRICVDGKLVDVRSADEAAILAFLDTAPIDVADVPSNSHTGARLIIGDDITAYFSAAAKGPRSAVRHLIDQFLAYVRSSEYVRIANEHGA